MAEGKPLKRGRGEEAPADLGALTAAVGRFLEARLAADRELATALLLLVKMCATPQPIKAPRPAEAERPAVYLPKQVQALLGISRSTYYTLLGKGHLPYTRLYPGGPRVHTRAQLEAYFRHLDETTQPPKGRG